VPQGVPAMEMRRTEGWEARLEALFEAHRATPFDWRDHNCVTFSRLAVEAMTGACPALPVPAAADSALDAARELDRLGGLEAVTTRVMGPGVDNWKLLRRGDLALADQDGRLLLAVCSGRTLCGPGPRGLEHLPLRAARKVWRVG
jgi:hypothetical protein